jgi:kynureninase
MAPMRGQVAVCPTLQRDTISSALEAALGLRTRQVVVVWTPAMPTHYYEARPMFQGFVIILAAQDGE